MIVQLKFNSSCTQFLCFIYYYFVFYFCCIFFHSIPDDDFESNPVDNEYILYNNSMFVDLFYNTIDFVSIITSINL